MWKIEYEVDGGIKVFNGYCGWVLTNGYDQKVPKGCSTNEKGSAEGSVFEGGDIKI